MVHRRDRHVVILTLIALTHVTMIGLVICMPWVLWLFAQRQAGFALRLDPNLFLDAPFATLLSVLVLEHCAVFVLTVRIVRKSHSANNSGARKGARPIRNENHVPEKKKRNR